MSQPVAIDSQKIAEIRNALTIINLVTGTIDYHYPLKAKNNLATVREQVKRIDKLLPDVKCPECKGNGWVGVYCPPDNAELCDKCKGSGLMKEIQCQQ